MQEQFNRRDFLKKGIKITGGVFLASSLSYGLFEYFSQSNKPISLLPYSLLENKLNDTDKRIIGEFKKRDYQLYRFHLGNNKSLRYFAIGESHIPEIKIAHKETLESVLEDGDKILLEHSHDRIITEYVSNHYLNFYPRNCILKGWDIAEKVKQTSAIFLGRFIKLYDIARKLWIGEKLAKFDEWVYCIEMGKKKPIKLENAKLEAINANNEFKKSKAPRNISLVEHSLKDPANRNYIIAGSYHVDEEGDLKSHNDLLLNTLEEKGLSYVALIIKQYPKARKELPEVEANGDVYFLNVIDYYLECVEKLKGLYFKGTVTYKNYKRPHNSSKWEKIT